MSQVGHLKVAMTTKSLTHVDCAFALAKQIVLYDVTIDGAEFIDVARFSGGGGGGGEGRGRAKNGGGCWMDEVEGSGNGGDRITPRVEAVADCKVIFTKGLSDLAAVKLRDAGVFPVKLERDREIDEVIVYLQRMMAGNPPLWMRRALGHTPATEASATVRRTPLQRTSEADDDDDDAAVA